MKHLLLTLFALTPFRVAAQAPVGSVASDFTHSVGSTTLTSNRFTSLTASSYSAHDGSVIVACYYTPW